MTTMNKEFENYWDVQTSLEEVRDNIEVIIHDCGKSKEEEEARIKDDASEACFYADFLESLMKRITFVENDKETLKFAVIWLHSIERRKEEVR